MGLIPTIYYCGYANCSAKFKKKLRFESHQRMHSGERPFTCTFSGCDKSYISASHLKRHEVTHETQFRCKVKGCAMILKTKSTLKKHIDCFHGKKKPKTYKCTLCDAEFNKHSWLQRHMVRHTGQAPHVCPIEDCGKGFLLPSKLKRHMKIHEGYPCKNENCDKIFPNWSTLVKHKEKAHPIVRSLKCEFCEKVFTTQSNLKAHQVVHREERNVFTCDVPNCSRFYFFQRNLQEHMRSFHKRLPFMCNKEHCNRAFKTEAQLAEHVLYHGKRKPRWKKKKHKPTFAAKLAGCVEPKVINRKPKTTSNAVESDVDSNTLMQNEGVTQSNEKGTTSNSKTTLENTTDITETVCDKNDPESCLSLLEGIINNCARET